jgi:hypothetical protein
MAWLMGLLISLAAVCAQAQVLPAPVIPLLPGASYHGEAQVRWWGFKVYRAQLWNGKAALQNQPPYALNLLYQRAFAAADIAAVSADEMLRLGAAAADVARWRDSMARIFPDVAAGDQILGVALPGETRFYQRDRLLGRIEGAEFARYFFGIWLNEKARIDEVRALIGAPS